MSYTVQIEACDSSGRIWQAVAPAETCDAPEDEGTARYLAEVTAQNQNICEPGSVYRVRVWNGAGADTSAPPDAEYCEMNSEYAVHTDETARQFVIETLDGRDHEYGIEKIMDECHKIAPLRGWDFGLIDPDEYWAIVASAQING